MKTVGVVGASGYIGGELLRLVIDHPMVELVQATSDRHKGIGLWQKHPNLRGKTRLQFSSEDSVKKCDILFLAKRHGGVHGEIRKYIDLAEVVIDLSADFRLPSVEQFSSIYKESHLSPDLLGQFVPGFPEFYRDEISRAALISVPGCIANAAILAIEPLASAGLLQGCINIAAKTGSSGSGSEPSLSTHHPTRSGVVRVFVPAGHRHEAEVERHCNLPVTISASSVEMVRGVHITAFASLQPNAGEAEIRNAYRGRYGSTPFVRMTRNSVGAFGLPEPKLLNGSNMCDIGYAISAKSRTIVVFAALDNLMKGGAGNAVQCMNIRIGCDERAGLEFTGLYPA